MRWLTPNNKQVHTFQHLSCKMDHSAELVLYSFFLCVLYMVTSKGHKTEIHFVFSGVICHPFIYFPISLSYKGFEKSKNTKNSNRNPTLLEAQISGPWTATQGALPPLTHLIS